MHVQSIQKDATGYPALLSRRLGQDAPETLHLCGDGEVLERIQVGVLCSVSCPGSVVIKTLDAIREIRDAGIVVAGGFHSPMERECLRFLLRGRQQVLHCPAVGLRSLQVMPEEQQSINEGRLSLLSVFDEKVAHATPELASRRNDVVAALARVVLVVHAVAGGKAEAATLRALARQQWVLTLEDSENAHLVALGAHPVTAARAVCVLLEALGSVGFSQHQRGAG